MLFERWRDESRRFSGIEVYFRGPLKASILVATPWSGQGRVQPRKSKFLSVGVGRVERDQLLSYAERAGVDEKTAARRLSSVLAEGADKPGKGEQRQAA